MVKLKVNANFNSQHTVSIAQRRSNHFIEKYNKTEKTLNDRT